MKAVLGLRAVEAELPRLVEFAEKFSCRGGLPDSERAKLLIILEELFTNTVRYGYSVGASEGRIEVALAAARGRIEIDFSDDGAPFDPLAQGLPEFDRPANRSVGGLGLRILRSLVDEARYRREGGCNHLALVRKLDRPGRG
jgi:anti-sigma regulatory factor (Ser/Thr protein kinase)